MTRSLAASLTHRLARRGIAPASFLVALGVVMLFVLIALLAPLLLGSDPFENHFSPRGGVARYQLPSLAFPFGTNVYGQDIFQQTLLGAQRTLIIGFVCGLIVMTVGTLIGVVSGYFGGATDAVLMRVTDFFYAIPFLPFALVFVHFFGTGLVSVCSAMGLIFWRTGARVIRSVVLSLRERHYVKAAKAAGADHALSHPARGRRDHPALRRVRRGLGSPHGSHAELHRPGRRGIHQLGVDAQSGVRERRHPICLVVGAAASIEGAVDRRLAD
jgi:ABC-type dipeptide/oligopeptide/nickel transport system permease subunit